MAVNQHTQTRPKKRVFPRAGSHSLLSHFLLHPVYRAAALRMIHKRPPSVRNSPTRIESFAITSLTQV